MNHNENLRQKHDKTVSSPQKKPKANKITSKQPEIKSKRAKNKNRNKTLPKIQ